MQHSGVVPIGYGGNPRNSLPFGPLVGFVGFHWELAKTDTCQAFARPLGSEVEQTLDSCHFRAVGHGLSPAPSPPPAIGYDGNGFLGFLAERIHATPKC